jgi:xylan 1,4-beta-xylosidase
MGIAAQLSTIDAGFAKIAAVPALRAKPIVIGESDPDGCAACQGPQLGYRNGTMYASYTAASFARKHLLADRHGVNLEGALTWAFEFEDQPYFAGFRVMASNGIDLPVLNVFRMFGKMSGQRVAVTSSGEVPLERILKSGVRDTPDVSAMASVATDGKVFILAWHYHDDDVAGPDANVEIALSGLPGAGGNDAGAPRVTQYLIDETHSNAFTAWQRLGSPQQPTPEQYAELERAGQLATVDAPPELKRDGDNATLRVTLPRKAVTLIVIAPR